MFFRNIHAVIIIICFTEIILYKVVMVFGFKHFCTVGNEIDYTGFSNTECEMCKY